MFALYFEVAAEILMLIKQTCSISFGIGVHLAW